MTPPWKLELSNLPMDLQKDAMPVMRLPAMLKDIDIAAKKITFTMNQESEDRGGDIIYMDGGKLDLFRQNPVAPKFHQYRGYPAALWEDVRVEKVDSVKALVGVADFSETTQICEEAEKVWQFYSRRIMRAVSVGIDPVVWQWNEDRKKYAIDIMEWYLLECSFVLIGQHPDALSKFKPEPDQPKGIEIDCPSCRGCHSVELKLSRTDPRYSHWGLCESTGEPFFLSVKTGTEPPEESPEEPPEEPQDGPESQKLLAEALLKFRAELRERTTGDIQF